MLNIEARHLEIIEAILNKYDYSFFVFGSRITTRAKRLSDLDLFFLEHIPDSEIQKIEMDFEDSDLPYKVDIVDFNKCESDFQHVILANYICIKASTQLLQIESNALGHFEYLPKALGYSITVVNGVSVINCGLHSSMWNIAYGAPNSDIFSTVETVKQLYNSQPFAWWIPQSKHNPELSKALEEHGLVIETTEHAMIRALEDAEKYAPQSSLSIKQVSTEQMLQDFISVLMPYDSSVHTFYGSATLGDLQKQERLFIGYENSIPNSIGILYVGGESAGIFSVLTLEGARGKGYGTEMMRYMVTRAKDLGCKTVTLSASSDSGYRIYERLNFRKLGAFECFEHKGE